MVEILKRIIALGEKQGKDANSLRVYCGHKYLAYNMTSDGTDYEIGKKEGDCMTTKPTQSVCSPYVLASMASTRPVG